MSRFVVSETIPQPLEAVWALASDLSNAPRWMNGVDAMRIEGRGPIEQGSALVFVARGAERGSTVAKWEPERCFALRSVQGGVTATYTYTFEAHGHGSTRVTLDAVCEFRGAMTLMSPLIGWLVRRTDGGQLRDLAAAMKEA